MENSTEFDRLIERLKGGDASVLGELFGMHRESLRRMIELRLDARLNGRLSSSDVLQEAYIDAAQRLNHFLAKPELPFHVWLRLITGQRIIDLHRQHLGAQMRDAACEVSLEGTVFPQVSSVCLAKCLAAHLESPSQAAMRKEMLSQLEEALNTMDPIDREVLALRHFEEMSNDDVAVTLGLQKSTASNRYIRALGRLKDAMTKIQGAETKP